MSEPRDLDVLTAIHCARPGHGPRAPEGCTFCQLIAESEATRAELERAAREFGVMAEHARTMHTRAERAEAERDSWRNRYETEQPQLVAMANDARAAIARALELVEPWETSDVMQEIRAALRGTDA